MGNTLTSVNHKSVSIYFCLALSLWGIYLLKDNMVVSLSDSLNYHLFIKKDQRPGKGDYVTFDKQHTYFSGVSKDSTLALTKKIICVSGDHLSTKGNHHFCNGIQIAEAKQRTGKDRPLSIFEYNGIIPDNLAYVRGDKDTSFDSRYFGLVGLGQLEKVAPIL